MEGRRYGRWSELKSKYLSTAYRQEGGQCPRLVLFSNAIQSRVQSGMESIIEELKLGKLTFIVSVLEKQGCRVFITAKDEANRRIWKTPLMDESGNIQVYSDAHQALEEAKRRVPSIHNSKTAA